MDHAVKFEIDGISKPVELQVENEIEGKIKKVVSGAGDWFYVLDVFNYLEKLIASSIDDLSGNVKEHARAIYNLKRCRKHLKAMNRIKYNEVKTTTRNTARFYQNIDWTFLNQIAQREDKQS
jgi:hypothetical protein